MDDDTKPADPAIQTDDQSPADRGSQPKVEEVTAAGRDPERVLGKHPAFWQAIFAGCTALFGMGLLFNGIVTSTMLHEQKKLTRQQVVGTQAAEVNIGLSLYPNSALSVIFDLRGVVAARHVTFKFRAVRQRIPELTDIEHPITKTIELPVFSRETWLSTVTEYALPGLTPTEFDAIKRTEQTVKVEGEFSYDNGFGDVHRASICQYWLSGIPNVTEDQGGANAFYSCDGFEIRMKNVLKARKGAGH